MKSQSRKCRLLLVLLCCILSSSLEATQYLGLGYEPGQGKDLRKAQIVDGYIYVPTSNGLFRKSVSTLNDTIWEFYGFKGVPVRDFVKKNDSIIAITTRINDNLMMLSTDNGKTFIDYTSSYFKAKNANVLISKINGNNKNCLLIADNHNGISKSTDFGKNWSRISSNYYTENFHLGFNPGDSTSIILAGVTWESPAIFTSYNSGLSWIRSEIVQGQMLFFGDFYYFPNNWNSHLISIDNWIFVSRDKGSSWQKADKIPVSNIKFAGDPNHLLTYAIGKNNTGGSSIYFSQGGDFWYPLSNHQSLNISDVYDFHILGENKLIFTERGVYNISAQSTSLSETTQEVSVVQNGTTVSFKGTEIIESVRIYNISGKLMKTIHPKSNKNTIDISSFQKGLYIFEFGGKESLIKKKFLIR